MSEHHNSPPPAQFSYAVGAGLGLLVGVVIGLATDTFLLDAILGLAAGLVGAYIVRALRSGPRA